MTSLRRRLAVAAPAALLLLAAGPARAERTIRIQGGIHLGGSASLSIRPFSRGYRGGYYRPRRTIVVAPSLTWGAGIYLGPTYVAPPPCLEGCYYPPPPPPVVEAAPPPEPALRRLGLGVFAGGTALEGGARGDDLGVVGRVRLAPHLLIEGELGKTAMEGGERIDRSIGGAVLLDLAPWSPLSLYLLAGGGVGSTDRPAADPPGHVYGELGVGAEWRLGDRVSLLADLRGGRRRDGEADDPAVVARQIAPAPRPSSASQGMSRGRLGLLIYF